jgi:tryptophanyl-tRNA synthetase
VGRAPGAIIGLTMSDGATGSGGAIRIFSGIQPTGSKHLGNLIGAIRQYVEGQERGESIYCLVDLHAITVDHDPERLRVQVHDTVAILLAAGLDPERCILFRQSEVAEHTYLSWLLANVTSFGELRRMHQFKEKSAEQRDFVSGGLFFYPVLQAADILAYQTDEVPVGEDQKQHIELARAVAERFNARFGQVFTVPQHRIPGVGARVLDLQDPEKKMSTTGASEQGTVYIVDPPDAVARKFKAAVTDSGREIRRAPDKRGISNLVEIMAVARGTAPEDVEAEYANEPGYARFKQDVGTSVSEYLRPIREAYEAIRPDVSNLESILHDGAERARAIAGKTVETAADRMGLGPGPGVR